jgi:hypothetical protein
MTPEDRRKTESGFVPIQSDEPRRASIRYWQSRPVDERIAGILEARRFFHEVMRPGSGASRLDRSVGGTRSLRD